MAPEPITPPARQGKTLIQVTGSSSSMWDLNFSFSGSSRNKEARNPYNLFMINYLRDFDIFFLVTTSTCLASSTSGSLTFMASSNARGRGT
jgi:hypothetical protein